MRAVDVSIVTYAPDLALLQQLFASLAGPLGEPTGLHVHIEDNSPDPQAREHIATLAHSHAAFHTVRVERSGTNVGFGRGHNANAARGRSPWLLVLNQDCVLEPGALRGLIGAAAGSAEDVAAWEMRQVPYEHPKSYDPVTLETPWVSGAASMFRRDAFEAVGGFEERIFMYGEDVDLSWRLRARGYRLLYQPRCAVVHRTYREAGEVKPLQVLGGVATNLCLRARFGGPWRTLEGLAMLAGEIGAPQSFPGRRLGLVRAGVRFLRQWPYFARTRVPATSGFAPVFSAWDYELRREGAFVAFAPARERRARRPLVSILVRTVARPAWLRQALQSCANQTYPEIEVVVVEDGPERSREVVESFGDRLRVRYLATGSPVGRARAGNVALAHARGEWLNFLDDDDVLFADHVETLVDAVMREPVAGAYALAWETQVRILDRDQARYEEVMHATRHHQRFDRLALWHHNYLPIQAVLFHRRLYARHGGFAEDMDQLEDWNLWTRYTLDEDFVLVPRTTSKYRVPAEAHVAADRQAMLDRAYADALERQRTMRLTLSPRELSEMAERYTRSQTVVMVTRGDLRRIVGRNRLAARVAAYRPFAGRVLRRMGWLK
ncbi:MAG TPA: glycosyltransferase family 2 protein [Usitatibacter sp.]|nr:glycosyltransferase family 2 protein [Usitatibacter sp.]